MRILLVLILISFGAEALGGQWKKLPPLPDQEGFAGPFAGVSGDALIVAGGANFPGKKPWDGGEKVWYDSVFVLEEPGGPWKIAGKLPRPLGYGVSLSHGEGVVCVGGCDAKRHYADAFRLEWKNGKLITKPLPPLPKPIAYGCGALVEDVLYVAGGQEAPDANSASNSVWKIDLEAADPKWKAIEPCPGGGRILATAAAFDGSFWMIGGAEIFPGNNGKVARRYLTDGYRYDPEHKWQPIAPLPRPAVAAPSPAPSDATGFYLLGGDDGTQVGAPPQEHLGFNRQVLHYAPATEKWTQAGQLPAPRVTVPLVIWNGSWIVPNGEVRPGVRSPEVWVFQLNHKE